MRFVTWLIWWLCLWGLALVIWVTFHRPSTPPTPPYVAFVTQTDPTAHIIQRLNLETGTVLPIVTELAGIKSDVAWSGDGRWLAFVNRDEDGQADIWRADADGKNLQRLTTHPNEDDQPHPSPNGAWVAFLSQREGQRNLYVMPSDGGTAWPITFTANGPNGFTWASDGDSLIFAGNHWGDWQLYEVSMADVPITDPNEAYTALTQGGGNKINPLQALGGQPLGFEYYIVGYGYGIYMTQPPYDAIRPLSETTLEQKLLAWMPNRRMVALHHIRTDRTNQRHYEFLRWDVRRYAQGTIPIPQDRYWGVARMPNSMNLVYAAYPEGARAAALLQGDFENGASGVLYDGPGEHLYPATPERVQLTWRFGPAGTVFGAGWGLAALILLGNALVLKKA